MEAERVHGGAVESVGKSVVTRRIGLIKLLFFVAAGLSFLGSVYLWFTGRREEGIFVGIWVPSILAAGAVLLIGEGRRDD